MKTSLYAHSNKQASILGFGGWQLGNAELFSPMTEEEGISLVKEAYENGITLFDTAPGYANGKSEIILGKALHDVRDKVILNTKFGHRSDGTTDFSSSTIEEAIRDSLSRLQTDYLDSVLLHNPSMDILSGKTDHFKVLKQLKNNGLIRAYGVSIDTIDEFRTVLTKTDVDVIEILFNIFFQSPLQYFTFAKAKKISVIIKVPLDSGWLTGRFDDTTKFTGIRARWTPKDIERRNILIKELKKFVHDDDLTKYAMSFIASFDGVTSIIPGIRTKEQLHDHLDNINFKLDPSFKTHFIELYNHQIKNNPFNW